MIESRIIVLDNIHILQVREGLNSYVALSKHTGINVNTIKSWFATKNTMKYLDFEDSASRLPPHRIRRIAGATLDQIDNHQE